MGLIILSVAVGAILIVIYPALVVSGKESRIEEERERMEEEKRNEVQ